MDIFSIFFNKKIYYVFSLEPSHRGDSNEYTQYTILYNIYKKENHPKLSQICSYEIFSQGLKNEFEKAMVYEPSVLEPHLFIFCLLTYLLTYSSVVVVVVVVIAFSPFLAAYLWNMLFHYKDLLRHRRWL